MHLFVLKAWLGLWIRCSCFWFLLVYGQTITDRITWRLVFRSFNLADLTLDTGRISTYQNDYNAGMLLVLFVDTAFTFITIYLGRWIKRWACFPIQNTSDGWGILGAMWMETFFVAALLPKKIPARMFIANVRGIKCFPNKLLEMKRATTFLGKGNNNILYNFCPEKKKWNMRMAHHRYRANNCQSKHTTCNNTSIKLNQLFFLPD